MAHGLDVFTVESRQQKLWSIFEVHGVVVIPLAAPDEAVALEDVDDF